MRSDFVHCKRMGETMSFKASGHAPCTCKQFQNDCVCSCETFERILESVVALFGHLIFVCNAKLMALETVGLETNVTSTAARTSRWSLIA